MTTTTRSLRVRKLVLALSAGSLALGSLTGCGVDEEEVQQVKTELEKRGYTDVSLAYEGQMSLESEYNLGYGECRTTIEVSKSSLETVPDVNRLKQLLKEGKETKSFRELAACFPEATS